MSAEFSFFPMKFSKKILIAAIFAGLIFSLPFFGKNSLFFVKKAQAVADGCSYSSDQTTMNCYKTYNMADSMGGIFSEYLFPTSVTGASATAISGNYCSVSAQYPYGLQQGDPVTIGMGITIVSGVTYSCGWGACYYCCSDLACNVWDQWGGCAGYYCPSTSVQIRYSGTRNYPDNPFAPHWANIGVTTGSLNLASPTYPILYWSSSNSSQQAYRIQVYTSGWTNYWDSGYVWNGNQSVQTGALLPNTTYYWRVAVCGSISGQWCAWTPWAYGDSFFTGPTMDNVTISVASIKPDNSTSYAIRVYGSEDGNGAVNIYNMYALINYQGENAGAYRGFLTWYPADAWPGYKDHRACSGGGYAVIQPGYGDTYLRLDSCSISDSGDQRTATFIVRFDPSFTTPVTDSDISGYVCNNAGLCAGWTNFQTNFNVSQTLNVAKAGSGSGTVASYPPDINCGPTCSSFFDYGQSVSLYAVASSGSTFAGWSGEGCSDTGTCGVSMTQARNVTATFTIDNRAPSAINLSAVQPDYCVSGPAATFSWTFSDPDSGDTQSAYQVQADNSGAGFPSPEVNTGKVTSASGSYSTTAGALAYNNTYSWRVMVWDNHNLASAWANGTSFSTPVHQYPTINFSWAPLTPSAGEEVQFADQSTVYGGATKSAWLWTIPDATYIGGTDSSSQNPKVKFSSEGAKSVTLRVTDSNGYACETSKNVNAQIPLPEWKEVAPQ